MQTRKTENMNIKNKKNSDQLLGVSGQLLDDSGVNTLTTNNSQLTTNKVEWKTLGEVAELKRGKTITAKDKIDGDIPVISGGQTPAYCNAEFIQHTSF